MFHDHSKVRRYWQCHPCQRIYQTLKDRHHNKNGSGLRLLGLGRNNSDTKEILYGVPQSSILELLLLMHRKRATLWCFTWRHNIPINIYPDTINPEVIKK